MSNIIELDNITKEFTTNKVSTKILNGIDLEVATGEFLVIMGPSGAGKSTLLYNICGIDKPTRGVSRIDGNLLNEFTDAELSKIRLKIMGFVFQSANLLENLTLRDNIILPGIYLNDKPKKDVVSRANDLIDFFGIGSFGDYAANQVSGGQLQRAAICRALINKPKLLFGDEPTGALNSQMAGAVLNLFVEENKNNTTIVVVTHDPRVASRADRIVYLLDGKIVSELQLGKFSQDDQDKRLNKVLRFLEKLNF